MNQLSKEARLEIEIKRKKHILFFGLLIILFTSNIPNFLPVILLDESVTMTILKEGLNYIVLPFVVYFTGDEFLKYDKNSDTKFVLPKIISNILIATIMFFTLVLFGIHASFEIKKNSCLDSDQKEMINYKQCLKEVENNRFKPFF